MVLWGKKILFWAVEDLDSCVLLISWLCLCLGLSFLIFKEDHDIWSHCFMANRWGSNGNRDRFYFFGLQITDDGDYSHEIKRCFLFGRKAMTNLDSMLKSRDTPLPTKVHLVKLWFFHLSCMGVRVGAYCSTVYNSRT